MRKPSSQQTRGQRSETSTLQDKDQPNQLFEYLKLYENKNQPFEYFGHRPIVNQFVYF